MMALAIAGLSKSFGGEAALDDVDLHVADGQIHALLGPNGSGKSTLIGCVSGRLAPDAGSMTVGEQTVSRFTPRSAFAAGAAVIYQHFSLIPSLTVADNVFLGTERVTGGFVDRKAQVEEVQQILDRLGASLDPLARVSSLSAGEQQLVEIAKALRHRPQLLILDEPTAALGELESRVLGEQLRALRASGLAILYVTHFIGEVFEIADKVTVLRDGRVVLEADVEDVTSGDVVTAIAPRAGASASSRDAVPDPVAGDVLEREAVLELADFGARGVGPLDLRLGEGEVVAVFGLLGSGRTELLEGLYGIGERPVGKVSLLGEAFVPTSALRSLERGLALVPAERLRQGMFAEMTALENMLMPHFHKLGRAVWRDRAGEESAFAQTARLLRLTPVSPHAPARSYSGGNQQKLVVGRWLAEASTARVLLLDEPTQGIDVGARRDLYELVRQFVGQPQHGVLFTSSDPEEVQTLADRAYVLHGGRIVAELARGEIETRRLIDLAHGGTVASQRRNDA